MGLSFKKKSADGAGAEAHEHVDHGRRPASKPGWRDRRRAARRDAGWMSTYTLANEDEPWAVALADNVPCVVHDLSITGAGLELARAEVTLDDHLLLDLQLGSARKASIQLTGAVRHMTPTDSGCVRVGVEFVAMGTLERALLQRLLDDLKRRKDPIVAPSGPIEIYETVDGTTDLSTLPDPFSAMAS
ncbi:MAG: PilZ domain-containing protein [Acidimicrobiia bacterium]